VKAGFQDELELVVAVEFLPLNAMNLIRAPLEVRGGKSGNAVKADPNIAQSIEMM
jgi:hypothetical protein